VAVANREGETSQNYLSNRFCRVSTVAVQRFCKPKVGGSNPSPGTKFINSLRGQCQTVPTAGYRLATTRRDFAPPARLFHPAPSRSRDVPVHLPIPRARGRPPRGGPFAAPHPTLGPALGHRGNQRRSQLSRSRAATPGRFRGGSPQARDHGTHAPAGPSLLRRAARANEKSRGYIRGNADKFGTEATLANPYSSNT
jgi:hypothetical protein